MNEQGEQTNTDDNLYMILVNNEPRLPMSLSMLAEMLRDGTLPPTALVWRSGMPDWLPLVKLLHPSETEEEQAFAPLKGFSLFDFLSDVFRRHSREDVEHLLCAGTLLATPPLRYVSASWPRPWFFTRMILFCLVLYLGFSWALATYQNENLVPGLIFVGNFGIPFCLFMLFFELNVRRDVALYTGIKAMIWGGLLALIFSLFLFCALPMDSMAWVAGIVEEPAKLIAVVLVAGSTGRNGRILTGLLLGAAVGAGFAAFESAGYTYRSIMSSFGFHVAMDAAREGLSAAGVNLRLINPDILAQHYAELSFKRFGILDFDPTGVMELRALSAFATHVVWSAIMAGAYWRTCDIRVHWGLRSPEQKDIDWGAFVDIRFLRVAIIPVVLHVLWNSNLFGFLSSGASIVLFASVAWLVVLILVAHGLRQVARAQSLQ